MFFFDVLEIVVAMLVALFVLFQIVIPIWNGTALFPAFRAKAWKIERQIAETKLNIELAKEQEKLHQLQSQVQEGKEEVKR